METIFFFYRKQPSVEETDHNTGLPPRLVIHQDTVNSNTTALFRSASLYLYGLRSSKHFAVILVCSGGTVHLQICDNCALSHTERKVKMKSYLKFLTCYSKYF